MIPFGNQTVTLIHRTETTLDGRTATEYKKLLLHGCSWRRKTSWRGFDAEKTLISEITCRIPANQQKPAAGDCLFLGEIRDEITDSRSLHAALKAHRESGAFQITTVADNTGFGIPMPHYAAWGGG